MSDQAPSRFTPQNKTTNERLSTHTVGLVALSDFRKRRAEVLEQQEREAREGVLSSSGVSTPIDRSLTGTPDNAGSDSAVGASSGGGGVGSRPAKKKKGKVGATKLSFGDEEDGEEELAPVIRKNGALKIKETDTDGRKDETGSLQNTNTTPALKTTKLTANASVSIIPKAVTKAALRREAAERETLRREFLLLQEAVKATEIAIPFVFYDGTDIPGGVVRVRKGDFVWLFLDRSRKVGAELGVGEKANARREWARVGVDDLMLVRGTIIVPHVSIPLSTFEIA
jgi:protein FAM50